MGHGTSRTRALVLGLVVLLTFSCTQSGTHRGASSQQPISTETLRWSRVQLATGVSPSVLTSTADRLLVGGRAGSGAGRRPKLLVSEADSAGAGSADPVFEEVALRPRSPYAAIADVVSVASGGDQVYAVGAARGGAHSNVRWSVWAGTSHGVTESPQTFETFGGPDAGGLIDIVLTTSGPMIVGTWSGLFGLDAAVWLPQGVRWLRQPSSGTPLANIKERQVSPRRAIANEAGVIISGSVIELGDGVKQSAAVWTLPRRDGDWRQLSLPQAGVKSEAVSAHCSKSVCWVSGHADGRLALWSVEGDQAAARITDLPEQTPDADGPGPRTFLLGERPGILFSDAATTRLLLRGEGGWQLAGGPPGVVVDATVVGSRLYAIASTAADRSELWQCDLAAAG